MPECDTQTEVIGICWEVLEKGQCFQGNIKDHGGCKITCYSYNNITVSTKGRHRPEHRNKQEVFSRLFNQYEVPVYAVPFIFGTSGNVIPLIIIICNKDMRTLPNMYILNLATSDIFHLTVLFCQFCADKISDMWLKSDIMCTFLSFCRRFSVCLSAYSVAVFSIQRYRVTVNQLQIRVSLQATWRVTLATICVVWIVTAFLAVPSVLSMYLCQKFPSLIHTTYLQRVVIFEFLVSCVLPLCVIAFTYIRTGHHLVESSRSICEGTQNPQLKTRRNTAKIVVGLTYVSDQLCSFSRLLYLHSLEPRL